MRLSASNFQKFSFVVNFEINIEHRRGCGIWLNMLSFLVPLLLHFTLVLNEVASGWFVLRTFHITMALKVMQEKG